MVYAFETELVAGDTVMDSQQAERIAKALEQIVEKLGAIETKIEELTFEVQAHGNMLCDAISPTIEECDN
jgi:hypothetical protein